MFGTVWGSKAFAPLEDRLGKQVYWTRGDARADVIDYVERFYNLVRGPSITGHVGLV